MLPKSQAEHVISNQSHLTTLHRQDTIVLTVDDFVWSTQHTPPGQLVPIPPRNEPPLVHITLRQPDGIPEGARQRGEKCGEGAESANGVQKGGAAEPSGVVKDEVCA